MVERRRWSERVEEMEGGDGEKRCERTNFRMWSMAAAAAAGGDAAVAVPPDPFHPSCRRAAIVPRPDFKHASFSPIAVQAHELAGYDCRFFFPIGLFSALFLVIKSATLVFFYLLERAPII